MNVMLLEATPLCYSVLPFSCFLMLLFLPFYFPMTPHFIFSFFLPLFFASDVFLFRMFLLLSCHFIFSLIPRSVFFCFLFLLSLPYLPSPPRELCLIYKTFCISQVNMDANNLKPAYTSHHFYHVLSSLFPRVSFGFHSIKNLYPLLQAILYSHFTHIFCFLLLFT